MKNPNLIKSVTLTLPSPDWEICEDFLSSCCLSVSALMKEENAGLWTLVGICEIDDELCFKSQLLAHAHAKGVDLSHEEIHIRPLENKDWLKQISLDFPAFSVENFWIHGTHIKQFPPPNHIELIINAATAFGSGEHETTKGCLILLKKILSQGKIPFYKPRILDMGTGSGILLIALAKYLLNHTPNDILETSDPFLLGVDSDFEAISVSVENAHLNQVGHLVDFQKSMGFEAIGPYSDYFDLIMANIVLSPLCLLCKDFRHSLKPRGHLIVSGLLQTHVPHFLKVYEAEGFTYIDEAPLGEWNSLLLQKK